MRTSNKYKNVLRKDPFHSGVISVFTEPQVAIGQRAFLLCTDKGNVLWDCITYIDEETVRDIQSLGGIAAIVISHPHYYSTALHWAEAFDCKVYLSAEDEEWVMRRGPQHVMWEGQQLELLGGQFLAVKVGGHFPGSSVLLWKSERKLFVADSIMIVPSGVYHTDRPADTASFAFMWSYPNMVSTSPRELCPTCSVLSSTRSDMVVDPPATGRSLRHLESRSRSRLRGYARSLLEARHAGEEQGESTGERAAGGTLHGILRPRHSQRIRVIPYTPECQVI